MHADDIREEMTLTSRDHRRAVRQLLDEKKLTTVFQPIWDIHAGELSALEALSRPDPGYGLSGPEQAFDIAEQLGRIHELDILCATHALNAVELPRRRFCSSTSAPRPSTSTPKATTGCSAPSPTQGSLPSASWSRSPNASAAAPTPSSRALNSFASRDSRSHSTTSEPATPA